MNFLKFNQEIQFIEFNQKNMTLKMDSYLCGNDSSNILFLFTI